MNSVRFVFMADCQLGCYATFSGMTPAQVADYARRDMRVEVAPPATGWAWDAERLRSAVAIANGLGAAFVVVGGDMVDDPASDGQYQALREVFGELTRPVHWVPGNHDCAPDARTPTVASLAAYRARFGEDRWAFSIEGVFGIAINTVVLADPQHVPDELDSQLFALEQSLRLARQEAARHIVVFGHHPLFTHHVDEPDSYWNIPQRRRSQVVRLCNAFGVEAYFCGHWHRNGGGRAGNLEVVVTGPVGYPLGADPSGLRVVDVDAAGLVHHYLALHEPALARQEL